MAKGGEGEGIDGGGAAGGNFIGVFDVFTRWCIYWSPFLKAQSPQELIDRLLDILR